MKKFIIFLFFISLEIAFNADAASMAAKQKYPYPLLTDDYGILNENDLAAYTWGLTPRPFTEKEISGIYKYWQCFPKELISITLEDTGFSSENIGWRDNIGDLLIRVTVKPNLVHEYSMRAQWAVKDFEKTFNDWRKIMKNENYVCLAGEFSRREYKIENGRIKKIYSWTFSKMKTKKGCDAYFNNFSDCHISYKEYLAKKYKDEKWKEKHKKLENTKEINLL